MTKSLSPLQQQQLLKLKTISDACNLPGATWEFLENGDAKITIYPMPVCSLNGELKHRTQAMENLCTSLGLESENSWRMTASNDLSLTLNAASLRDLNARENFAVRCFGTKSTAESFRGA